MNVALQCSICTELFTEPHTVDCGHTFCYQCLKQWLQIRKQCPTCRKPLTRRPMLTFTVQHQVEIYLAHFTSKSEGDSYKQRVENERNVIDPWQDIFRKERNTTYLEDVEDDTRRCLQCNWELVGQQCVNCGEIYHDAPEDSEEGESVNTGDEAESVTDANESDRDFIVDDDVVDYEDSDSADEILDADIASNSESEGEHSPPSRGRNGKNRQRRQSPVFVDLANDSDSEANDDDDESILDGTKRSTPFVSSDDDDFQLPVNRPQKRKRQNTFKSKTRKVIALDDSDEDDAVIPESSNGRTLNDLTPEPTIPELRTVSSSEDIESSQNASKKRIIRDTSEEERSGSESDQKEDSSPDQISDDDEDDLEHGLLELDGMASNQATNHTNGEITKPKSKKSKKHKHKKHKHQSKSEKRKEKGKAKA
ncbi:hypothetical protein BGW37DRAFT_491994 [Umbelopsis sp. PMI_123]|nr:hypothetical protein BGW37DRAFT_491994 [Umbelopsis sp. PMI_123]